jgi:hypothetical protein
MAYRFRGLGVVLEVKNLLDDYKKFAMHKLYLVNVLCNLALHLLFECFHYFDVFVYYVNDQDYAISKNETYIW